jgi:hypothetical protein
VRAKRQCSGVLAALALTLLTFSCVESASSKTRAQDGQSAGGCRGSVTILEPERAEPVGQCSNCSPILEDDDIVESPSFHPRFGGSFPTTVKSKLEQAFPIALAHLRDRSTCRRLFEDLGADGLGSLRLSVYCWADSMLARRACGRGVVAFTQVRSPFTWICTSFGRLSTKRAALILIHEALHRSGLGEQPVDPEGLTASEINALVARECQ